MTEMFVLRKRELARRVETLLPEVVRWRAATEAEVDKNVHFSQLAAIEILTNTMVAEQQTLLAALDPAGGADTFNAQSLRLVRSIIRAQKAWDFFRDKLALRHSPDHRAPLWVADTVAWDCHRPVLDQATVFGILNTNEFREPPLVYCSAEYSPATWVRGARPNDGRVYDLGEATLPIPVIEMPWDHLGNAWEYLTLHHEVGHDIEADLKLRPVLRASLQAALSGAGVPAERIQVWLAWEGEVLADLVALQLAGPAFAETLAHLLLLPAHQVKAFDEEDPHPTPYLRILLNVAHIRTQGNSDPMKKHAAQIESWWKAVYGGNSGSATLDAFEQDFPLIFQALLDTRFPVLKDHTVRELIPYTAADDQRIRSAERFFRTGMNRPANLRARHTVSAARLAVDALTAGGAVADEAYSEIHNRVLQYVKETAPPGLRGGGADIHARFVASFAERMFRA